MKISKELAKGSTGLLVLSVISKTDMYGYQIIKTLEVMSENVFSLNEGTLYPILHSLEKEGSLESYWCEAEGRKRKYYKITESGLAELADKKREWQSFSGAVSKVLGGAKLAAEMLFVRSSNRFTRASRSSTSKKPWRSLRSASFS